MIEDIKKYFSIIVPIYNVEKYLKICVDSVLAQTFGNFELILVDDGSPDKCGNLCDDFERQDSRISVVHKKNGGLSNARNTGIDVATGKYLIFLDSDDFWDDTNALKNIALLLEESNADILIFPAKRFYEEREEYTYILNVDVDRNRVTNNNKYQAIEYLLENNIYRAAAWNKVIKKKIVDQHNIRYKEGYLSEDMDWCGDLLLYSSQFDYYNIPFYCYRQQRAGSITTGKNEKLVEDKLFMCEKGAKQAKHLDDKNMRFLLSSYYAYEYAVTLGVSGGVKNAEILNRMKALNELLYYDKCQKVKKIKKLKKYIGYELTRKALCWFVKLKR